MSDHDSNARRILSDMSLTDRQREQLDVFLESWDSTSPDERHAILRAALQEIRRRHGMDGDE